MAKVCPTCSKEYGDADLYCPADGSTLRPLTTSDDLIGTVVADRYLITDKIGEGGMGRVYLARHVRLPQNVAIKILHPAMVRDPGVVARFKREAINASQIENEHVARVFDHGELGDGLFYIAMEFVEGEPLSKIIEREGPLAAHRAAEITRQVADALAAAHERPTPIVHRDLKPDNIMVGVRRDGSDRVKVVDFGIAEAMHGGGPKLTQQGLVIGTPEYMSPEQLSAITLDWRSDIYSLALVTFDMLTGRLPFPAESPHEAALMRLRDRPRTLSEMKGDVAWPTALQVVMDRALARAPGDRYETAPEFARAFGQAITAPVSGASTVRLDAARAPSVTPISSGPDRPALTESGTRTRGGRRRTPLIAGLAAVALIAVVAIAISAWRSRSASQLAGAASASTRDSVTPPLAAVGADSSPTSTAPSPSNPPARQPADAAQPRSTSGDPPALPPADSGRAAPRGAPTTRDLLDHIETLIVRARADTVAGKALARAVLDSARVAVPRLESRADIVELGVYTTAAYILLGQERDACFMLESIGEEALQVPKFFAQVKLWNDRLSCRQVR